MSRDQFPAVPSGTVAVGCGTPYALIKRGGAAPGKRPFTKLAFITLMRGEDGGRRMVVRGLIQQGSGWTKRPAEIAYDDIVARWRAPPSSETIARRRRGLPRS
jgi:hypothetical protein